MRNNVLGARVPDGYPSVSRVPVCYTGTRVPAQSSLKYSRVPGCFFPEIIGYPFNRGTRRVTPLMYVHSGCHRPVTRRERVPAKLYRSDADSPPSIPDFQGTGTGSTGYPDTRTTYGSVYGRPAGLRGCLNFPQKALERLEHGTPSKFAC